LIPTEIFIGELHLTDEKKVKFKQMKLNAILVEDEEKSREILRNYLTKYCPNISILGEAANVEEAVVLVRNNNLDVVFLDVEMPYGNAFDFLDKVGDINFETIFVTAYNHYAIDALNAHASYYLMKPISIDELIKAVDYVTEIRMKEDALQNQVLVPKTNLVNGKITIPLLDGFEVIETADIMYCKADDNYTEIYLNNNKKKLVSKTLKYVEDSLKDSNFARVHKSYLVNVNEIVKYVQGKGGSVVLSNGKEIMVSASKKSDLLSYFK
jgi:two-component system LytT family response regulator